MNDKSTKDYKDEPDIKDEKIESSNINDSSSVVETEEYYPEEEYIDNTPFQDSINTEKRETKTERANRNNTQNVKNAAEVAKKVPNPYAKVAGHVVSAADKVTGGKSSELLGKAVTNTYRFMPGGRRIQKSFNRINESGVGNFAGKIASISNKHNLSSQAMTGPSTPEIGQKGQLADKNGLNKEQANEDQSLAKKTVAVAKDAAKEKAKEAAKKKAKQAIVKFIASNPWVLLVLGGLLIFAIILIAVIANENDHPATYGLAGYSYYHVDNLCETVTVYKTDDDGNYLSAEVDFEKEYIPGVIYAEIGYFANNINMAKLFAIAARSYAIAMMGEDCTIEGSDSRQAFTFNDNVRNSIVNNPNHPIMKAVDQTYGLVFVKNDELQACYYDAACYREEDDSYYYIGYGSITLGEEHLQPIPKEWAQTQPGLMEYINDAKDVRPCFHNHGYGISQYGAYYLATEEKYNYEQLIEYYFGEGELKSIYESTQVLVTSTGANDILTVSLDEFLTANGSSVEAFNEYILSEIMKVGFGTREAAVAVANATVGGLYQNYNARIPYTLCGQHYCNDMRNSEGSNVNRPGNSFYGVDPNWGTAIHNNSDGTYHYVSSEYNSIYTGYGPDCSGFISWILYNAGFKAQVLGADTYGNLGPRYQLAGYNVGKPGDLVHHNGHIMMIVGVDESSKVYYIAHAAGGSEGVKINTLPFSSPNDYVVDMTTWYNNNKSNITAEDFRAGYVNGYTGATEVGFKRTNHDKGVYFVGDSRTVGLCYVEKLCSDTNECATSSCLAKVGAGKSWFSEQLNNINNSSKGNIVINMGVNDLVGNANAEVLAKSYYELYKSIAESDGNRMIYIMSVNPVGDSASVSSDNVVKFNNQMQRFIFNSRISNLKYLNTYSNVSFGLTNDGLHYDFETYKKVYEYVMGVI